MVKRTGSSSIDIRTEDSQRFKKHVDGAATMTENKNQPVAKKSTIRNFAVEIGAIHLGTSYGLDVHELIAAIESAEAT